MKPEYIKYPFFGITYLVEKGICDEFLKHIRLWETEMAKQFNKAFVK